MQAGDQQARDEILAAGRRVTTRAEACRLIDEIEAVMGELEAVLDGETGHLRAGRISHGLASDGAKSELAGSYLRGVQACKANAVALARLAPVEVSGLKNVHTAFRLAVERNQLVLATARAVSESLVRGLADEMNRSTQTQGYGASRKLVPLAPRAMPIMVSRVY